MIQRAFLCPKSGGFSKRMAMDQYLKLQNLAKKTDGYEKGSRTTFLASQKRSRMNKGFGKIRTPAHTALVVFALEVSS